MQFKSIAVFWRVALNKLVKMAALLLLTLLPGLASAIVTKSVLTAYLTGPSTDVVTGLSGFDLWIETATIGAQSGITSPLSSGGLTITYDKTALTFDSFDFAPGITGNNTPVPDSGLCGSSALSGCVSGIVILPGTPPYETEVAGGIKFGTFFFYYGGGSSLLQLGEDAGAPLSFSLNGVTNPYEEKHFISTAVVPLPLAAWLMLSGLGMLGAFGFRKAG